VLQDTHVIAFRCSPPYPSAPVTFAQAHAVAFACSLRISPVPGTNSVPAVTYAAAYRQIFVDVFGRCPAGARVRTRLRVSGQDEAVLRAVGLNLGSLASQDYILLAQQERCSIIRVSRWYRRFTLAPGVRVDSQAVRLRLITTWSQ
jgi:hypothetical protein